MNQKILKSPHDIVQEKRDSWFEWFINQIRSDRDFINLSVATKETETFYDKLIFGDKDVLFTEIKDTSSKYFIGKLIVDYIQELKELDVKPLNLFVDINNSELLVWGEVEDEDEKTERALFKAEAKANAKNYNYGYHVSSTIVEKSDKYKVPPHYQNLFNS